MSEVPQMDGWDEDATANILAEVMEERGSQHGKWGEQNWPDGTGPLVWPLVAITGSAMKAVHLALNAKVSTDKRFKLGTGTYADILLEEVFEALAEDDRSRLRAELIQVAAVSVAWAEKLDREALPPGGEGA